VTPRPDGHLPMRRTTLAWTDPLRPRLREEVLRGLTSYPKTLPAKLLYDEAGAALFERITALPEYYLTRAEIEILTTRAPEIAELAGRRCALIEYGSGPGNKVRPLLDALVEPLAYIPVDVSAEQLARTAGDIAADYPHLRVRPLLADYTAPLQLPPLPPGARRLGFFPGSTIGNFHPREAASFLGRMQRTVSPGGAVILGVDRRKDQRVLHAAYNDSAGITAAFNLNLLRRINRELGATFDLQQFQHRAFFNDWASRVEMHLVSLSDQTVTVADESISFERGESIWTESSYKYDAAALERLASTAGLRVRALWTDDADRFWVAYLDA
jgi:dimethylhistidine N-methyltransferase